MTRQETNFRILIRIDMLYEYFPSIEMLLIWLVISNSEHSIY